jgi:hypothetical protein
VVKVDPVYTYNPLKIYRIWHQNDQELTIVHPIYDSIRFGRENQKRSKYDQMCPRPLIRTYIKQCFQNSGYIYIQIQKKEKEFTGKHQKMTEIFSPGKSTRKTKIIN